jgi:hypothetical protein
VLDAELAMHALGLIEALVTLALGPKELEPSFAREDVRSARLARKRLVLRHAVLDQRRVSMRDFRVLRRPRITPVLP